MLCDKANLKLEEATYNEIRRQNCNVLLFMHVETAWDWDGDGGADEDSKRHSSAYEKGDIKSKWVSFLLNFNIIQIL